MNKVGIILLGSILLFTACTKEKSPVMPEKSKLSQLPVTSRITSDDLTDRISVSERGFLILNDSNAYADYLNFLEENSAGEIATFHGTIGFSSQVDIPGDADNYIPPTAMMNGAHVFNETGIVQIGSVIYRGVNSDGYYMAMPASHLNDETYAALASKEFDPMVMCKLKVGGDYGDNLEAFVNSHIGYSDPSTPPTPPEICERKITHIYSDGHGTYIIDESWYFLGYRYRHVITIIYP